MNQPVIVIPDLTEDGTIESFVMKVRKQDSTIQPDNTWRVFFPNNLLQIFVWQFDWEKRKDYLVDMTKGDRTLKEIGIRPKKNRLVYFQQFQFKDRDEP